MAAYNHKKIEKKWREAWQKSGVYKTSDALKGSKSYVLDMFPYPSGEGLHVGHPKGYFASDIYARFKRMNGFAVLRPMGWDAFGLPAENFAIKNKIHPAVAVEKNIKRFKEQLSFLGFNYDWEREINTTDPEYYRWTQWIFLKLFEKGLAYESYEPINWCPSCKTGLANEDLEDGKCERCGSVVEKRPLRQWVLRITDYADRLLEDLDELNWPESIKESQRNWIGRSEGSEIQFLISNSQFSFKVFTTRADTLFGATYVVFSPEHPLIENLKFKIENYDEVVKYIEESKNKPEIERAADNKEKTGVELRGVKAINPANNEALPIFIADYVLAHYGTGAIMAVPAHDNRDLQFAIKYGLKIRRVIRDREQEKHLQAYEIVSIKAMCETGFAWTYPGILMNSDKFNDMDSEKAKRAITEFVGGKITVKYKIRDWVFSRQRYWGEPIPLIHCDNCMVVAVPESDLPVKLPEVKSYEPTGTGESPLANIAEWVNVKCPKCGGKGKRETNTMPQWAGSSWYYLRYIDSKNNKALVDKKKEKYWSPIDVYVGGAEHATRHLIYARFWHKFLYDLGVVNYKEPFSRLQNVGLITAKDGKKMSKRYGNVVNPDDVVEAYGADTLRVYEMFMGPFDQTVAWSSESIIGARRFLEKAWRLQDKLIDADSGGNMEKSLHKTIQKVSEDIEGFRFNTAISQLMIFTNAMDEQKELSRIVYELFIKILAPFAPHMAEEIWERLGNKTSIHLEKWPEFNSKLIKEEVYELVIQINGKVRERAKVSVDLSEEDLREFALKQPRVRELLAGQSPKKVVVVRGRLVNIVI